ncbi:MAG: hypothetical protein HY365_01295 [Candidatus Aenigmarchaeota archaeon]|nr:hypothetical protein [Candidatus Aenigmarchaeota archaeon]
MRFTLLDADRDGGKVRLFGVSEKGAPVAVTDKYEPYFYVLDEGNEARLSKVQGVKRMEKESLTLGMEKKNFLKVFCDSPMEMRDRIKHFAKCFEYSIGIRRKYLIDRGFYPLDVLDVTSKENNGAIEAERIKRIGEVSPKLKMMALDIEVIDGKIVMFSIATKRGAKAFSSDSERDVLLKMEEFMRKEDPDIVATYNGDLFDFDVIRKRCEFHGLNLALGRDGSPVYFGKSAWTSSARIAGRVHIDLYAFVSRLMFQQLQSEVLTLGEVSQELLGKTKVKHSLEELETMWKNDRKAMEKYCINDSRLTLALCENLMPQIFTLSRVSGQLPFDCSRMTFGALSEWYLMRKCRETGRIIPDSPHFHDVEKRRTRGRIKGGYVKEPVKGLHSNIAVFDFRSLYPSVIVSFNISPETLNVPCKSYHEVPGYPHRFCRDREGFVPQMLKEILEKRAAIKKKMKESYSRELNDEQFALKILANATYGMFANPNARWYSYECAEASAAYGRHYIQKSISEAEKYGFLPLYGDTDSLFVKLPDEKPVKKSALTFLKKINSELPGMVELNLQGFYKKGLFVPQKKGDAAKKRYALMDERGSVTVRGLEAVRRDWCRFAKELQKEVLRLVLLGKEERAAEAVRKAVAKLAKRDVPVEELTVDTQLSRPPGEYKTKNLRSVLGSKMWREGMKAEEGTIFSYVIRSGKGTISDKADFSHRVTKQDYDVHYYVHKQVLAAALRILAPLGYGEEDFLAKGLEKFTGRKK